MPPNKKIKSCGVLIVEGDPVERLLLMQHPNRLDLPKGHTEPGETEIETALRELEEETGITSDDIQLDDQFRFTLQYPVVRKGTPCDKTLVIFLARLVREVDIVLTEHQGFLWHDWVPGQKVQALTIDPLFAALAAHLGK